MKAFEIIKIGSNLLKEKEIPSFILDSEILLSKTLKKSREEILKVFVVARGQYELVMCGPVAYYIFEH